MCLWIEVKRNHCVRCDELGKLGILESLEELGADRKRLMVEIEARRGRAKKRERTRASVASRKRNGKRTRRKR